MQDKYKEIIENKFNEISKPSQELNLYVYDLLTKNGIVVTEELAKEYCQKIIHLASLSFDKGMEAQKLFDDTVIENILKVGVLNDKKEI